MNEMKTFGPVGPIVDLNKMANVTGLSSFQSQLQEIGKEVERWRMVLGDGNCFYRAFMFSYLEVYILSKNIFELKKFVYDFYKKMDCKFKRKNISINKFNILAIFNIIIDYLERGEMKAAYEVFIKSYHLYENFDFVRSQLIRDLSSI